MRQKARTNSARQSTVPSWRLAGNLKRQPYVPSWPLRSGRMLTAVFLGARTQRSASFQFLGPAAGTLRQVAFLEGLHPPDDPPPQVLHVAAPRLLAEDLGIPPPRIRHGQAPPKLYIPAPPITSCQVGHGVLVNLHLQRTPHVHEEFTNQASPGLGVSWYVNSPRVMRNLQTEQVPVWALPGM